MDIIISIISTAISFGSLIASFMAFKTSKKNYRKQIQLTQQQTNQGEQQLELSRQQTELSRQQGELTQRLNDQDQDFERKRFITALWDKMANVVEIQKNDQDEYDENDIFDALNTLELVAICWENEIIDRRMVFLVFGDNYRLRVKQIEQIDRRLQHLGRNGLELLQERQIILNVYDEINKMAKKKVSV